MQYPLDFNMTSYHINLRNEKQDMKENAETINLTIMVPLQKAILKLRKLREEIPTLRLVRNNLKDDILKVNEQIKDADDSEEEEDLLEQI